MSQLKQMTAIVHGYVQGVSFRYYTQRAATQLGLNGWVANRRDGTVKVVAVGGEVALRSLLDFLKDGSPAAHVQQVAVTWADATNQFHKFSIRLNDD